MVFLTVTFVSYGTKLKQCTKLSSPLAEAIDQVFHTNVTPNAAPVLTVPAAQAAKAGQVISFVVSATDADTDPLSFTVSNAAVVDNGDGTATVTYKAPNTAADQQDVVKVTVSDGRKSVTKEVVVNVKGSGVVVNNTPPVLTAPTTAIVVSGQQVVISVSSEDAEGDALAYTVSAGSVAATATGADITFTAPAVTVDTLVDLKVTVSDGQATDTATIAVTVTAETGPVDTTWDPNKTYNTGDVVTYKGVEYTAKWWTKGEQPDVSAAWEAVDDGSVKAWSAGKVYNAGAQVIFNGQNYRAKWWTKGDEPGKAGSPWELV